MGRPPRKRICVIGAGASGIAALHELARFEDELELVCYESRDQAGGTWLLEKPLDPEFDLDDHGRPVLRGEGEKEKGFSPSPMYESLRTNIPSAVMAYRRFAFDKEAALFPTREAVLHYLQVRASQVSRFISYSQRVDRLFKTNEKWTVEYQATGSKLASRTEHFDHVVIANGHYAQPYVPAIPGLESWPSSRLMHSKWYRKAKHLSRMRVLVVGASASGSDISRQLAELYLASDDSERFVYFSIRSGVKNGLDPRDKDAPPFAKHIRVVPGLDRIENGQRIVCGDQILEDVELIVLATGYTFHYPFLRLSDEPWASAPLTRPPPIEKKVEVDGHRESELGGLRVHCLDAATSLFYRPDATLALPCLAYRIVPFPFAEAQARVIAKLWTGRATIDFDAPPDPPSRAASASISEEAETKTAHELSQPHEFDYADRILRLVGEGTGPEVGEDGSLGAVASWRRSLRSEIGGLRRATLGY